MKKVFPIIVLLFAAIFMLSACSGNAEENPGNAPGTGETQLDRPEPPAEYAGMTNPNEGDAQAAQAGGEIFSTNCAVCHGETGVGDGPSAASLDPAPENLAENEEGLSDAYLYWRIAEGGMAEGFSSSMPAWKGILSEEQIWQVVTFIRTLD